MITSRLCKMADYFWGKSDWFDEKYIFLILGRATSKFGSMAYLTVLPLYILDRTQSLAFAGFFFDVYLAAGGTV